MGLQTVLYYDGTIHTAQHNNLGLPLTVSPITKARMQLSACKSELDNHKRIGHSMRAVKGLEPAVQDLKIEIQLRR